MLQLEMEEWLSCLINVGVVFIEASKMPKKDRSVISSTPVEPEHIATPETHSVSIVNNVLK